MADDIINGKIQGTLAAILWLVLSATLIFQGWYIAAIVFTAVCTIIGCAGTSGKSLDTERGHSIFGCIILALFFFMLLHGEITFNSVIWAFLVPGLLSIPLIKSDPDTHDKFAVFLFGLFSPPSISGKNIDEINLGCFNWVLITLLSLVFCLLFGIFLTAQLYFMTTKTLYSNISLDYGRFSETVGKMETDWNRWIEKIRVNIPQKPKMEPKDTSSEDDKNDWL